MVGGILLGIFFGVLPGLAGPQILALLLPATFGLDMYSALVLLLSASAATLFAGSITTILIGVPGTALNAATLIDGFPLAKQGKAGLAIGAAGASSALGGIIGVIVLIGTLPLAKLAVLSFSFPEMFLLGMIGIVAISVMGEAPILKTLICGLAGFVMATIGYEPIGSNIRFTFGMPYLWEGIKVVPLTMGVFGVAEAFDLFSRKQDVKKENIIFISLRSSIKDFMSGIRETVKRPWIVLQGGMIGSMIGLIPGIGASVAQFVAYSFGVAIAKDKSRFGKGDLRGVIAPESSNNAVAGGALVPTLVFGIPGSVETAILLGAFTIHGITPGVGLINEKPELVYAVVFTLVAANIFAVLIGLCLAGVLIKLVTAPAPVVGTFVLSLSLLGAYITEGLLGDVMITIVFGLVGYAMKKGNFSRVALVIGLVLGGMLEVNLKQTILSGGLILFVTRPLSLILLLINIAAIGLSFRANLRRRIATGA
ncbi:MAG: hypothetical protein A3G26_00110 [Betaproteobacteria bacterium RIFCSPLOWO2_12_FULL_65_110]|nr:MAG: hypothetical protein A3G26_00110 [Betaproteobacteria bacterium RIFCSPLOWO2_12_FULL_65_110]